MIRCWTGSSSSADYESRGDYYDYSDQCSNYFVEECWIKPQNVRGRGVLGRGKLDVDQNRAVESESEVDEVGG